MIPIARSLLAMLAAALLFAACGDGSPSRTSTITPAPTCVAGPGAQCREVTATLATVVSTRVILPGATVADAGGAVPTDTPVPPAAPTSTPDTAAQTGETGIEGRVTIGPSCPVQRIDSPCPDRPYAARLTLWRNGDKVAETQSDAGGEFRIIVPPGDYLLIGERAGTFPRETQQPVTVTDGHLTKVQVQYDSGIR